MSVIGYSDILLKDAAARTDETKALEYLRIINTAGRDGAHVVSRLRDFYRPRGAADLFEPLDLKEIALQSIALAKPRAAQREAGKAVSLETDLVDNVTAAGIGAELREVLTNLIFNALDAIAGAGVVTVRTQRKDGQAILEVIDTGAGMTPEVRDRCLEPFFTTKGDQGTGLGLAMVFGIIKRHQGTLEIESEPGLGTTVRIRLPACAPSPETTQTTVPHLEDSAIADHDLADLAVCTSARIRSYPARGVCFARLRRQEPPTSAERHWCEDCNLGTPVEMNPVRFRGFTEVSLTRIDTLLPRVQRSQNTDPVYDGLPPLPEKSAYSGPKRESVYPLKARRKLSPLAVKRLIAVNDPSLPSFKVASTKWPATAINRTSS